MKKIVGIVLFLLLGGLLTQGFQCTSSKEMTTAKTKMKIKDYKSAETALREELVKRPSNDEAKILLLELMDKQNRSTEVLDYLISIQGTTTNPLFTTKLQEFTYNFWANKQYKVAEQYFARYKSKNELQFLDSAIASMEVVVKIVPRIAYINLRLADFYVAKENKEKELEYFQKYITALTPDLEIAKTKGFYMDMAREELIAKLGNPITTKEEQLDRNTKVINDKYIIDGKELFVLNKTSKKTGPQLAGWRYDPPADWHPYAKDQLLEILKYPFLNIIQASADKKNWEKALTDAKEYLKIVPGDENVSSILITFYQQLGKLDEAIASVENEIKANPKNKIAYAQLGDIKRKTNSYIDAIVAYNKALEIDPAFDDVLVNAGACAQNRAVQLQGIELEKQTKDSKYNIDPKVYEPFLLQAITYYQKAMETKKYKEDYKVISELISLYFATDKKDDITKLVSTLEKQETKITDEYDKLEYYGSMLRIYGQLKNESKVQEMTKKMEELDKKLSE